LRLRAYQAYRQVAGRGFLPGLSRRADGIGCNPRPGESITLQADSIPFLTRLQHALSNRPETIDAFNEMAALWVPPDDVWDEASLHSGPIDSTAEVRTNAGFVEQIRHQASICRLQETPVGDFLYRHLEELASLVRWTGAGTPDEYEDRLTAWHASLGDHAPQDGCLYGEPNLD
jgi:hypothetical protein